MVAADHPAPSTLPSGIYLQIIHMKCQGQLLFSINVISPQIQVLAMTSLKQRLKVLEKVLKLAGRQDRN